MEVLWAEEGVKAGADPCWMSCPPSDEDPGMLGGLLWNKEEESPCVKEEQPPS